MKRNVLFFLIFLLITGCNMPTQEPLNTTTPEARSIETILTEMAVQSQLPAAGTPLAASTSAATPIPDDPDKTLTICVGKEPESLFIYSQSTRAGWSILEGIYDGPFDTINGADVPVIFDDVTVTSELVQPAEGDMVINARGEPQLLDKNMQPTSAQEMMQTTITFKLRGGLSWSDGKSLTSADSVYSWQLSGDKALKTAKKIHHLTQSYEAPDAQTVVWKGIPGFAPQRASEVFWLPLPKHLMEGMSAAELLKDEKVNRSPIGWGPFQISEWKPGESLTMVKNPHYEAKDSAQTGTIEKVVYRFFGSAGDNNLAALNDGTCDIIDTSVDLQPDLESILEAVRDQKIAAYIQPQASWEQLTLNLAPIDEGKTSLFADIGTRQAIAACIDREKIVREVFYGQSEVPYGFYPSTHYLHLAQPAAASTAKSGADLLTAAGWVDADGDPKTPRTAKGIAGIADGTPLTMTLQTTNAEIRAKTASLVKEQLETCGVGVEINSGTIGELYQSGPNGALFGRHFEAALFSWANGDQSPCALFMSNQIPTADNQWIGMNVGGFQSAAFDEACAAARATSLLTDQGKASASAVQQLYVDELPVIPLYLYNSVAVSSRKVCGLSGTIGMRSLLANIETLSKSAEDCAVSQWTNIYE